jgi:plasmid stability protein
MTQLTIRRLDAVVIEGLKKRASDAGLSMEEEARKILSEAVLEAGLAKQRKGLEELRAARKAIFGDRVFPDSSGEFRKMRDERSRYIEQWALPRHRKKKK